MIPQLFMAVVRDRIKIEEGSLVDAGAVVIRDVPPAVVVAEIPRAF